MSKSKGNVVLPRPIANMLGTDAMRYFLLREVVFGQDGNFSYDALVTRTTAISRTDSEILRAAPPR